MCLYLLHGLDVENFRGIAWVGFKTACGGVYIGDTLYHRTDLIPWKLRYKLSFLCRPRSN
jgi:hypothetical protein